ncbi:MAG: hypothetical protein WC480_00755 [Patescibacteria group bacterium]
MSILSKKFIVLFTGVPGCSKTPIAHYLSWNLNLPIFSNDIMRTEVIEDHGAFDQAKYLVIRDQRLAEILAKGDSFIYDASVDRVWPELKAKLVEVGYEYFLINIELSPKFLRQLYQSKQYNWALEYLDKHLGDHRQILDNYSKDISFEIKEPDFANRLELAQQALAAWLKK